MTPKALIIALLSVFIATGAYAQDFRKNINKDSLFQVILATFPDHMKGEMKERYQNGTQMEKDLILLWFSDPVVTKNDLVKNIDSNYAHIQALKRYFDSVVPKGYELYIEVTAPSRIFETEETIDIKITPPGRGFPLFQEWGMTNNSAQLKEALSILQWNTEKLTTIKTLLQAANCISIENGEIITIGFARMGMGKYSFMLFQKDLSSEQVKAYNDGCTYIYYRNNIVLQYGGGAIGPQCFPNR